MQDIGDRRAIVNPRFTQLAVQKMRLDRCPCLIRTRTATIQIDGVVAGGTYSGISVAPGPLNGNLYDLRGSAVRITIGASGVVSGSGNAAVKTEDNYGLFASILNREGGVINGIAGRFIELENQGTIDGGSGAALSSPRTYFYNPAITRNSGLITSVGAVTTLTSGIGYITNTGTISNNLLGVGWTCLGRVWNGSSLPSVPLERPNPAGPMGIFQVLRQHFNSC